jgi:hypothetical protein
MPLVRILNKSGLGNDPYGAVVQMDDQRAKRAIAIGYAEAVDRPSPPPDPPVKRTKKERRTP